MITVKEEFVGSDKWKRAIKLGGAETIQMWLAMKRYAHQNPTNGFIPDEDIDELLGAPKAPRKALDALVKCGRLGRDGARGSGLVDEVPHGWELHDYLDHTSDAEVEEERREQERRRKAVWRDNRDYVAQAVAQGARCSYCGAKLTNVGRLGTSDRTVWLRQAVIDHVIPRCQGGTDEEDNLVLACLSCNSRKSGRTPEQAGMVLQ